MPYISDDPIRDFELWDAEQSKQIEKLPKCRICNEPIQDDYLFEIDGELICEDCLKNEYRQETEKYISEE